MFKWFKSQYRPFPALMILFLYKDIQKMFLCKKQYNWIVFKRHMKDFWIYVSVRRKIKMSNMTSFAFVKQFHENLTHKRNSCFLLCLRQNNKQMISNKCLFNQQVVSHCLNNQMFSISRNCFCNTDCAIVRIVIEWVWMEIRFALKVWKFRIHIWLSFNLTFI